MALLRALRTARATLTRTFYLEDLAIDTDAAVTVTAKRLDGTTVDTQTLGAPVNNVYTYVFPGSDQLDKLQLVWAASVAGDAITLDQDELEIVGGRYLNVVEARNTDGQLKNATTYPAAALEDRITEVEDECERICGQAFVPRFEREILNGEARSELRLAWPWIRTVRKVSVRYFQTGQFVDFDATQLAAVAAGDDGVLRLDFGFYWPTTGTWGWLWPIGRRNVIVEYEHGRDFPPPTIRRGARIRFRSLALQPTSALPDRAERIAVAEMGTVLLAQPDEDHTGIPEVDAAYGKYPPPRPGFG